MVSKLRSCLSFANVTAVLALFIALGGTGIAQPAVNTAASLGKSVQKALRLSKSADRKASKALMAAREANETAANARAQTGPPGPKGDKGDRGDAGLPASTVVAQARSIGPVETVASPGFSSISLTGNGWTQGASDTNLIIAEIAFTPPPACDGQNVSQVEIRVDGQGILYVGIAGPPVGDTLSPVTSITGAIFAPGAPTDRTVTARAYDYCTGPSQHYTIDSVKVDVIRLG